MRMFSKIPCYPQLLNGFHHRIPLESHLLDITIYLTYTFILAFLLVICIIGKLIVHGVSVKNGLHCLIPYTSTANSSQYK